MSKKGRVENMKKRINDVTKFGRFCRVIRAERDLLQKEMAKELGMEPSTLCAYEMGRNKVPQMIAYKIADVYNLTEERRNELLSIINEFNEAFKRTTQEKRANTKRKEIELEEASELKEQLDRIEKKIDNCFNKTNDLHNILISLSTKKKKRGF